MIVASPQGIWSWANTQTSVDAYIEFLKATYRVDASMIFLTGLSDGGEGVFAYANAYPTKVKAIVPVSTWPTGADIHNFINVPVWGFMGNSDTNGQLRLDQFAEIHRRKCYLHGIPRRARKSGLGSGL